jgi:hypothetical protein
LDPVNDFIVVDGDYTTDLSDWTVTLDGSFDPGGCVGARTGYTVRFRGNAVGGAGPAGFYDAPTVANVEVI